MINHEYIVPQIGYAQLGIEDDFEEKQQFEILYIFTKISELTKADKKFTKYLRFFTRVVNHDFGHYKEIVMYQLAGCNDLEFSYAIEKIDKIDFEAMEEDVQDFHEAMKASLEHDQLDQHRADLELTLEEVAVITGSRNTMDLLQRAMTDSVCASCCPLGCSVEPDGKCQHGFISILTKSGLI